MKALGKLFMYYVVGGAIFSIALLSDIAFFAAMFLVIFGIRSLVAWMIVGVFLYFWLTSKKEEDKPFSSWTLSTMKSFWKNWKEVCE